MSRNKIVLEIIAISFSKPNQGAYALILGEHNGTRRLPIVIGSFEAQSIAIGLEKLKPTRPLTHDLFKNFADAYNIILKEVVIDKFSEGVFYAKLLCLHNNILTEIDSRTSDAIALAVRFNCPVYTYEEILKEAGVEISDEPEKQDKDKSKTKKSSKSDETLSNNPYRDILMMTDEELDNELKRAIDDEAYELASFIRDEIKRRKDK
ncbi:MAG: bifunctional nuclease family protein [Bacteroidales bacterium]|nr:bifunctional nuclease family protein [Bacteroidales bacterium]